LEVFVRTKREVPSSIRAKIKEVGQRIATLRRSKNMTREKLAYGIGIAKSYLGYIERGESNPTLETLLLIAEGLECDVKVLVG
jgi:transcriptional regulator with XRE-family HTH domain